MLILLRHGRTPNNAGALLQGDVDVPLDEVGIEQATRAGAYIRNRWDIDDVVTSSLSRARATAEHAGFDADRHRVDDRWREIAFGEYENRKLSEVIAELGSKWSDDIHFEPVGGESIAALHQRVTRACTDLIERAQDEDILVVSHATPIKAAVIWATGGNASMINNLWVNTGTISVLDQAHGSVVLREFNRQIH